jgi:uroporphyrinogen-III decarboxylase
MRQAGRYLPEYNATRRRAGSFLALAKNPAFATEVTLQPLERYRLDGAILFSDILTLPDAMGLGLFFAEGEGQGSSGRCAAKQTPHGCSCRTRTFICATWSTQWRRSAARSMAAYL